MLSSNFGVPINSQVASSPKTNAEDIGCESVGVLLDDFDGRLPILFVNLGGIGRTDSVPLKKDHNFTDLLLGISGISNHLDPFFPYPFGFLKPLRIGINYFKSFHPKFLN
jgi:hypothetical protein